MRNETTSAWRTLKSQPNFDYSLLLETSHSNKKVDEESLALHSNKLIYWTTTNLSKSKSAATWIVNQAIHLIFVLINQNQDCGVNFINYMLIPCGYQSIDTLRHYIHFTRLVSFRVDNFISLQWLGFTFLLCCSVRSFIFLEDFCFDFGLTTLMDKINRAVNKNLKNRKF